MEDLLPDTFWELVVAALVLMAGAVVVEIGFTFDINRWQESKRKWEEKKLRTKCPHATFIKEGDQYGFESTFSIIFGTEWWRCGKCGLETHDIRGSKRMIERFASNRELYRKQENEFIRAHKKLYG
ncbi:MAG: hypothetical protein OXD43_05925 [Bacteroidetes bacterium]|nr:hypothetical protein [Bacteroidota bacterium]